MTSTKSGSRIRSSSGGPSPRTSTRLPTCSPRCAVVSRSRPWPSRDVSPRSGASHNSRLICAGNGKRDGDDMRAVSLLFHDVYATDPGESGFRSPAADRYKLTIPEFETQLDGLEALRVPSPDSAIPATLTFDDGGVSYYTVIADRLEAMGLRGYCFVTSDYVGTRGFLTEEQIRELDARGHVLGTHSASHPPRFSALTPAEMRGQWLDSRHKLEDILGRAVTVASVPGGYFSIAVAEAAAAAGLRTLFTSEPTTKLSA